MAQAEPQADDVTVVKDGRTFAVEREIAETTNFFEIDYVNGWLRKGFAIYANGSKSSC
jgi:Fe-S cluster assembly iron-binding protein IscA